MNHEAWSAASKRAYWDRDVPLDRWRQKTAQGHRSYLPDAVAALAPADFAYFYGIEEFKHDWPRLRAMLPASHLRHAPLYDLTWSQWVGHSWNLRPSEAFWSLPPRRRAFLVQAMKAPGQNVYQVAQALGMQYRRAHDHAVDLIQKGLIQGREATANGRRRLDLLPCYTAKALTGKPNTARAATSSPAPGG